MPRQASDDLTKAILAAISAAPAGLTISQVTRALDEVTARRTLQYRLQRLVEAGQLSMSGSKRSARYTIATPHRDGAAPPTAVVPISPAGRAALDHVRQPVAARAPVGYDRAFLEAYRPNETFYLGAHEREHLAQIGVQGSGAAPAGTYAKRILDRLLIDLAWNSSRLEGNTYSLLDTRRLIDFGQEAEGRAHREAQMILNHKDAIEFLVQSAGEIGFNRYTILNLHALLANNLLADPQAVGRLRHIAVGIERSVFHPLETPQLIEECFDQLLASAEAINDPFEQAFFIMAQLPYLQPFDDVNKRVSRLAANIPLVRANLAPLSFTDVPDDLYTQAMLAVYERRDIALLKDVFLWAYERSAARYAAVRQSVGEPDPFRLRHRQVLRDLIGEVIRRPLGRGEATDYVRAQAQILVEPEERDQLAEVAETELLALHEGNFARYQIRPSQYEAWRRVWDA